MRKAINLNANWLFHLGDDPAADFMGYDDSAWREVTLPHDWAVEHPFDRRHASGTGYLPGGTAWYRKHFTLPADAAGKRVTLTFGGVYKHARVWVNSHYLGNRAYGYATFTLDVTDYVRPGENVVCVRAEHEEVADSRWYTGSGIYRDVTLTITDPCCFDTDGVFVSTEHVDGDGTAHLRVAYTSLGGEEAVFTACGCTAQAQGPQGTALLTIPHARLWSTEDPALHTLTCRLLRAGRVTDEMHLTFGIRTIRFDPDLGFFLNGVNTKLKGVCVHHDAGALGAAVPPTVWERRLRKFKSAGCNALRTAHNPPDSHLLDLCDQLGLLVMDEAFDEWEGSKNKWWQGHNVYPPKRFGYAEDFPLWHKADLEGMVLRDRNHPSIIMWSIGNEIDYPNDPYVTPLFNEVLGNNDANKPAAERMYDPRKPDASRLATVARELVDIVHALDTTRPVTSALSFPELSTRTGYADVLDASGYNYKEQFYDEDHARFPDRVILGSENSHDPAAWYPVRDKAFISGQFLWTGVDFLGECPGWPRRISQAGMIDLAGYEKPHYYQRQALWTEQPMLRLAAGDGGSARHDGWHEHFLWVDNGEGHRWVAAYTNEPEVELFLNGRSLGKKQLGPFDGCRAEWEVPFEAGELRAVTPHCQDVLSTSQEAAGLRLCSDVDTLQADGRDVAQVEVFLHDSQGRPAARDERVYYQLVGDGQIIGIENGRRDDLTPYAERYRQTYDGRAIVYIRAGVIPEELTLHAYTRTGLKARCVIRQKL